MATYRKEAPQTTNLSQGGCGMASLLEDDDMKTDKSSLSMTCDGCCSGLSISSLRWSCCSFPAGLLFLLPSLFVSIPLLSPPSSTAETPSLDIAVASFFILMACCTSSLLACGGELTKKRHAEQEKAQAVRSVFQILVALISK